MMRPFICSVGFALEINVISTVRIINTIAHRSVLPEAEKCMVFSWPWTYIAHRPSVNHPQVCFSVMYAEKQFLYDSQRREPCDLWSGKTTTALRVRGNHFAFIVKIVDHIEGGLSLDNVLTIKYHYFIGYSYNSLLRRFNVV